MSTESAAAFRRKRREQGSVIPNRPGWRSQRDDQTMQSSAAAFCRKRREQGSETP